MQERLHPLVGVMDSRASEIKAFVGELEAIPLPEDADTQQSYIRSQGNFLIDLFEGQPSYLLEKDEFYDIWSRMLHLSRYLPSESDQSVNRPGNTRTNYALSFMARLIVAWDLSAVVKDTDVRSEFLREFARNAVVPERVAALTQVQEHIKTRNMRLFTFFESMPDAFSTEHGARYDWHSPVGKAEGYCVQGLNLAVSGA